MNIEHDLAITLCVTPFANTSSVLTWFSARRGRIATLAKGAQRPRSRFLGQADLFYTCEILYYPGRGARRLPILRECTPLKTRDRFRNHWRAMLCASYTALLLNRLCPSQAPHPPLFRLLDRTLDALTANGNRLALLFWFELQVMAAMGMAPNLASCAHCGAAMRLPRTDVIFSSGAGGILCGACRLSRPAPDGLAIAPDILALLAHWQAESDPARAGRAVPRPSQANRLERVLGGFIARHLDALYPGRGVALRCAESATSRDGAS